MKEFILKYFKDIVIVIFTVIVSFFVYKIYGTNNDNSELIKYKLDTIDKEITQLNKQRKNLDSSIAVHYTNIEKLDSILDKLTVNKTTINQIYQIKENEIRLADAKKIDSLLRLRYKY